MQLIEAMGLLGSLLSSITFVPQVYKVVRTRRTADLSMTMMCIVFASTIVWLVYGIGKGLLPVIICNSIISVLAAILIGCKLRWK